MTLRPRTFQHFMDCAAFGLQVVTTLVARRQWLDAHHYAQATRAHLADAERAARRESKGGRR